MTLKREPNAAAQADLGPETDEMMRDRPPHIGAVHPDADRSTYEVQSPSEMDRGAGAGNVVAGPAAAAPDDALRRAIESAPPGDFATAVAPVAEMVKAAQEMDWMQVVLNGGPPCFHLQDDGRFCGRAERWDGHDGDLHNFVSLAALLAKLGQGWKVTETWRGPMGTCPRCGADHYCKPSPGASDDK